MKFPQDAKTMKKTLKRKWPVKGQKPLNDADADDIKKKRVVKKITSKPAQNIKKLKNKKALGQTNYKKKK